jgi:4-aminobutyrate aminotransferase-like enzyme
MLSHAILTAPIRFLMRPSIWFIKRGRVRDRDTNEADAISATGFNANILKIRPPLVFSESDATRLLIELEAVFKSIS